LKKRYRSIADRCSGIPICGDCWAIIRWSILGERDRLAIYHERFLFCTVCSMRPEIKQLKHRRVSILPIRDYRFSHVTFVVAQRGKEYRDLFQCRQSVPSIFNLHQNIAWTSIFFCVRIHVDPDPFVIKASPHRWPFALASPRKSLRSSHGQRERSRRTFSISSIFRRPAYRAVVLDPWAENRTLRHGTSWCQAASSIPDVTRCVAALVSRSIIESRVGRVVAYTHACTQSIAGGTRQPGRSGKGGCDRRGGRGVGGGEGRATGGRRRPVASKVRRGGRESRVYRVKRIPRSVSLFSAVSLCVSLSLSLSLSLPLSLVFLSLSFSSSLMWETRTPA